MLSYINNFVSGLSQYSFDHNVNPYIFVVLYLLSIPFFYYPLIYLKRIVKHKKDKEYVAKYVTRGIIISSTAYIMPLVYVLLFGKNLPIWIIALIIIIIFMNIVLITRKFKRRGKVED